MSEPETRLTIKVETEKPLDLQDLTASFGALADEYRSFTGDEDLRLYVERISEGSIVATLVSMARDTALFAAPLVPLALETVAPFLGHWSGLLTGLANYGRNTSTDADVRAADKRSIRNARKFVQPALNGNPINVQGDVASITQINVNISPGQAGDITRAAAHLLSTPLPADHRFEGEPLALYQVRDAKAGDMGYLDRFDKRPRKLTFASEGVKNDLLHAATPFDMFFFVSGVVRTAAGEVASYHIEQIDSIVSKDAA